MTRTRVLSGLAAAALLSAAAVGQPPAKPADTKPTKPADPKGGLDEAIAAAVRAHPDVRVAEAEVQTAQAKLAQAKMRVAQQVAAARHAKDAARRAVVTAEQHLAEAEAGVRAAAAGLDRMRNIVGRGGAAQTELAAVEASVLAAQTKVTAARAQVEQAKADVAKADGEYDALVNPARTAADSWILNHAAIAFDPSGLVLGGESGVIRVWDGDSGQRTFAWKAAAPVGGVADRLKAALDKPVKLADAPARPVGEALDGLLKAAGLEVRVRLPREFTPDRANMVRLPLIALGAGEQPLGTWLQLFTDELWDQVAGLGGNTRYELYVREYGLMLAGKDQAPSDAVTVQQLWKQARAERAAAEQPKK